MRLLLRPLVALTLLLLMAAPARADSSMQTRRDPKGDVRLYPSRTISTAQKSSIDIDRATITKRGNSTYRFAVRLKKLSRSARWDQMVTFDSGNGQNDPRYGQIAFRVRNSVGASAYNASTGAVCRLTVKRKGRTVRVDVPARCAPYGGQRIRVSAYTGYWQTDAPLFSRDRLTMGRFSVA